MLKRGNKRGQFYLLAAILIITAIISYAAISNYSKNKNPTRVNDLGKELGIEGGNVLEYGVISGDETINEVFAFQFSKYSQEEGREIYFIFGDETEVYSLSSVDLSTGSQSLGGLTMDQKDQKIVKSQLKTCNVSEDEKEITCTLFGTPYTFALNPGENFYFVIAQKVGEEDYVVSG